MSNPEGLPESAPELPAVESFHPIPAAPAETPADNTHQQESAVADLPPVPENSQSAPAVLALSEVVTTSTSGPVLPNLTEPILPPAPLLQDHAQEMAHRAFVQQQLQQQQQLATQAQLAAQQMASQMAAAAHQEMQQQQALMQHQQYSQQHQQQQQHLMQLQQHALQQQQQQHNQNARPSYDQSNTGEEQATAAALSSLSSLSSSAPYTATPFTQAPYTPPQSARGRHAGGAAGTWNGGGGRGRQASGGSPASHPPIHISTPTPPPTIEQPPSPVTFTGYTAVAPSVNSMSPADAGITPEFPVGTVVECRGEVTGQRTELWLQYNWYLATIVDSMVDGAGILQYKLRWEGFPEGSVVAKSNPWVTRENLRLPLPPDTCTEADKFDGGETVEVEAEIKDGNQKEPASWAEAVVVKDLGDGLLVRYLNEYWNKLIEWTTVPKNEIRKGEHAASVLARSEAYAANSAMFLSRLHPFLAEKRNPIVKLGNLGGKPLDLYYLFSTVVHLGGVKMVCNTKGLLTKVWRSSPNFSVTQSSGAHNLAERYCKWLYAFEQERMFGQEVPPDFDALSIVKSGPPKPTLRKNYVPPSGGAPAEGDPSQQLMQVQQGQPGQLINQQQQMTQPQVLMPLDEAQQQLLLQHQLALQQQHQQTMNAMQLQQQQQMQLQQQQQQQQQPLQVQQQHAQQQQLLQQQHQLAAQHQQQQLQQAQQHAQQQAQQHAQTQQAQLQQQQQQQQQQAQQQAHQQPQMEYTTMSPTAAAAASLSTIAGNPEQKNTLLRVIPPKPPGQAKTGDYTTPKLEGVKRKREDDEDVKEEAE